MTARQENVKWVDVSLCRRYHYPSPFFPNIGTDIELCVRAFEDWHPSLLSSHISPEGSMKTFSSPPQPKELSLVSSNIRSSELESKAE